MRRLNLLALLLATPSAALAEPTISQLEATARAIQNQLNLSNTLSVGATHFATTGKAIDACPEIARFGLKEDDVHGRLLLVSVLAHV